MKKVIALLMVLLVLAGCTTPKSEVTPTPVTSETPLPESTTLPESTQRPVDESIVFEKTSVKGLFDVYVANRLPEQMSFKVSPGKGTEGGFYFEIQSSEKDCTDEESCTSIPFAYSYGTKTDRENLEKYIFVDEPIYQYENEDAGTIYIWECYSCRITNSVQRGAPDYYEELSANPKSLPIEELLSFEAR